MKPGPTVRGSEEIRLPRVRALKWAKWYEGGKKRLFLRLGTNEISFICRLFVWGSNRPIVVLRALRAQRAAAPMIPPMLVWFFSLVPMGMPGKLVEMCNTAVLLITENQLSLYSYYRQFALKTCKNSHVNASHAHCSGYILENYGEMFFFDWGFQSLKIPLLMLYCGWNEMQIRVIS